MKRNQIRVTLVLKIMKKKKFTVSDKWFWGILIFILIWTLVMVVLNILLFKEIDMKLQQFGLWLIVGCLNAKDYLFFRESEEEPQFKAGMFEAPSPDPDEEDEFYLVYDIQQIPKEYEDYLSFEFGDGPLNQEQLEFFRDLNIEK